MTARLGRNDERPLEKILVKIDDGLAHVFPKAWKGDASRFGQPVVQLQHSHGARAQPLQFMGDTVAGWHRDADMGWTWDGCAVVRVGVARYLAEAEGYDSIAAFHLNSQAGPATLEHVTIEPNGTVTLWVDANDLEDPQETMKTISDARHAALKRFFDDVPSKQFRRLIQGDGLMHRSYVRHTDPFLQATPEHFGLRTMPELTTTSAVKMFRDMVAVACANCPEDSDPATHVAVSLAAIAGQWSLESFDDRELSYKLGEDCDDMLIRARGTMAALKLDKNMRELRHCCIRLPTARQRRVATAMLKFIATHRILNCQGRACPPHPLNSPGEIIGHVYGLFIRDCDLKELLGLENGKPVYTTTRELHRGLKPAIMEATAASRCYPPRKGHTPRTIPGIESFRDEAYQSIDQCMEDDYVLYFFTVSDDKTTPPQLTSGISPAGLVRPYNITEADDVDRPADAQVCLLMLRAPNEFRKHTDLVQVYHEPDPTDLQLCWDPFYSRHKDAVTLHQQSKDASVAVTMSAQPPSPQKRWRTSSRIACGANFSELLY